MTVQISVTVWTILCFLALMFILDRLLFRPMLAVMDKRQQKIDAARRLREDDQRKREEILRAREEERLAAEKRAVADDAAALEAARQESASRIAEKKADYERLLAEERAALDEKSRTIQKELEPTIGKLAAVFAHSLQSWQVHPEDVTEQDRSAALSAPPDAAETVSTNS